MFCFPWVGVLFVVEPGAVPTRQRVENPLFFFFLTRIRAHVAGRPPRRCCVPHRAAAPPLAPTTGRAISLPTCLLAFPGHCQNGRWARTKSMVGDSVRSGISLTPASQLAIRSSNHCCSFPMMSPRVPAGRQDVRRAGRDPPKMSSPRNFSYSRITTLGGLGRGPIGFDCAGPGDLPPICMRRDATWRGGVLRPPGLGRIDAVPRVSQKKKRLAPDNRVAGAMELFRDFAASGRQFHGLPGFS